MSVFLATLAIRLIMIRDLATPACDDPVHHALLTRLIMQSGGYPTGYQPFLDLAPTQYHLGFHAIAAVFTWLTNLRIDQSLLILGQVINALMVFSVYYFALLITQRRATCLVAAVITGFMTPMPAYYTSWGRYTELAGLLIIPTAFGLVFSLVKENSNKKRTM
jgi:asparagine N-glycosylation enzyme membrane subunit Stt3